MLVWVPNVNTLVFILTIAAVAECRQRQDDLANDPWARSFSVGIPLHFPNTTQIRNITLSISTRKSSTSTSRPVTSTSKPSTSTSKPGPAPTNGVVWGASCVNPLKKPDRQLTAKVAKDLSVVIGNISKNKTVSTFSGKLPGCPNLFCDEDSGILVTVCRSRGYDRWTKAPMEPLNVAVHLEFLRQAIAGLPKPAPQCNWRLMEGSNNLFNYNFGQTQGTGYGQGSIQRTGYGTSKSEWDDLIVNVMAGVTCPWWEIYYTVSLGNSANHQEQPKRTESWHLISCDEAEVNYPNKELTPRDISDTKDRIERGLVKPVWDFTYYQVDKCGQYYCDSVNDVLVSVCGNKSWFGWSQSYVTNLLDVGIDALAERPDRKANCSWAHRWPSLSPGTDYRINYLIDRMLDIPISDYWRSVMPPSLKVNKVDLGKTCKDFNSTIKQKPMIPPPPKPVDIQFPDPNPASGMVMTKGTQYVGYVIKTDQNNGGMLLKHLKGTDDYLKKNRISSPDIITNTSRPVDIVELTEADCHAFVCDDHPDRNILLSLCGNWYPIADIPVSEDPRYRNATLAWLAMRSMLTAYMCAADEGDGKKFLGGDRSVYCSNTDSDIKDPMLTSNTTRGLVRQFKDGLRYGVQLGRVERLDKYGYKSCQKWRDSIDPLRIVYDSGRMYGSPSG